MTPAASGGREGSLSRSVGIAVYKALASSIDPGPPANVATPYGSTSRNYGSTSRARAESMAKSTRAAPPTPYSGSASRNLPVGKGPSPAMAPPAADLPEMTYTPYHCPQAWSPEPPACSAASPRRGTTATAIFSSPAAAAAPLAEKRVALECIDGTGAMVRSALPNKKKVGDVASWIDAALAGSAAARTDPEDASREAAPSAPSKAAATAGHAEPDEFGSGEPEDSVAASAARAPQFLSPVSTSVHFDAMCGVGPDLAPDLSASRSPTRTGRGHSSPRGKMGRGATRRLH